MLKDRLEETTGYAFNSMLANLYRDGHDSVAWHADDETSLGPNPTIASLSFGDTRNFEMRQNPPEVSELSLFTARVWGRGKNFSASKLRRGA